MSVETAAQRIIAVRRLAKELRRLFPEAQSSLALELVFAVAEQQALGKPPTVTEMVYTGIASERTIRRAINMLRETGVLVEVRSQTDRRRICLEIEAARFSAMVLIINEILGEN